MLAGSMTLPTTTPAPSSGVPEALHSSTSAPTERRAARATAAVRADSTASSSSSSPKPW